MWAVNSDVGSGIVLKIYSLLFSLMKMFCNANIGLIFFNKSMPWVFWQKWWDNRTGEYKEGPYINRSKIMRTLCRKEGLKYFRFHALRHFGASLLKSIGTDERFIQ